MKSRDQIPYYAPDGTSLGFRTLDAAERLVAGGYVKASYGRKKNLRAIWLCQEDGGNPAETHAQAGTRYSFLQKLGTGQQCWKLRRVDGRDDDGMPVATRNVFLQETGEPIQERHEFSYRDLESSAGIVQSGLQKAVDEALKGRFIRRVQKARIRRNTAQRGANGWRPRKPGAIPGTCPARRGPRVELSQFA